MSDVPIRITVGNVSASTVATIGQSEDTTVAFALFLRAFADLLDPPEVNHGTDQDRHKQ